MGRDEIRAPLKSMRGRLEFLRIGLKLMGIPPREKDRGGVFFQLRDPSEIVRFETPFNRLYDGKY